MQQLKQSEVNLVLKLLAMKLFIFISLVVIIGCFSGCKAGGKWIKAESPNIKIISSNSSLKNSNSIPDENKTTSKNLPLPKKQDKPQVINEPQKTKNKIVTEEVNAKSFRSRPTIPPNSSVEAQPFPFVEIEGVEESTDDFKPTENIVSIKRMNVVPENNPPNTTGEVDKPITSVNVKEDNMKIDWTGLLTFYFISLMIIIMTWMVCDLIKDFLRNKKRKIKVKEDPFQEMGTKTSLNGRKRNKRDRKPQ